MVRDSIAVFSLLGNRESFVLRVRDTMRVESESVRENVARGRETRKSQSGRGIFKVRVSE